MLKRIGLVFISVLILTLLFPASALAFPQQPHQFYGTVTIGDQLAEDGITVSAKIGGVEYASTTTDAQGRYGYNPDYGGTGIFSVPADDPDTPEEIEGGVEDDTIEFWVNSVKAEEEYTFAIGGYTELPLSITGPPPVTLESIAVTPESASVLVGQTQQFTATGTYSEGDPADITDEAIWTSLDTAVATVDEVGLATGVATGTTTITATLDEKSDSATLTVTAAGGGGGAPSPTYYTETTLFGTEDSFRISSSGKILETIEATSADGNLTITIPKDTIALNKDGKRLASLETAVDESPPDPPEDTNIIGLAYDFGPDGATFDPAITLEYTYDPDALPEGVAEEDLVLAYYDEATGEWVELDCVVDTVNNTITASVAHFTTFAIIGTVTPPTPPAPAAFSVSSLSVLPAEVAPGEEVNISVLVANTGGKSGSYTVVLKIDGVKEAEERVTVRAGLSKEVTFSVTKEEAGSYAVTVDGLSGSFTVAPVVVLPEPAAFSVSSLSVLPAKVEPSETVTIAVSVANTGGESGSYTVVLKIDGVKEAEETVTIAAGESQDVTFSVTKEEDDTYSVSVDGLSGSFTVVAPAEEEEEEEEEEKPGFNWPLYGGIIGGVLVVGLGVFFWMRRRRAY